MYELNKKRESSFHNTAIEIIKKEVNAVRVDGIVNRKWMIKNHFVVLNYPP